jgi:secondary thiamine-phosphate synthase enzyme
MPTAEFAVSTPRHACLEDITSQVYNAVRDATVRDGLVTIFCPHTTGGITINENADPDVLHDMLVQLEQMVPWDQPFYDHGEGNSAAHVKSSMIGCSETIPLVDGRLTLGTWQGIYFAEFDGPRRRRVIVQILGQADQRG